MSRPALLAAYEKLAALLGKLPGALQEPILRELDPIKEIFLRQRAPRIAVLGDLRVELPALLNDLAGMAALHTPLARGSWTAVRGAGIVEFADLRGPGEIMGSPADLYLFVAKEGTGAEAAKHAARVLGGAAAVAGGNAAGLVVVEIGETDNREDVLRELSAAGAAQSVLFFSKLESADAEKGLAGRDVAGLGDRLCDYLPGEAQLEMARFLGARGAQARLAAMVLKSFGAVAGVIGMNPLPLADFPVLLALQMFMVSLIIYTSGREFSLRLAGEFAASLGIGFSAGLLFRETARAAVKILPVWGHMISGGVAGAGTYALGRAAIAYYIEGKRPLRFSGKWLAGARDRRLIIR
jgi:uncharacterized protein (DUF697 family)